MEEFRKIETEARGEKNRDVLRNILEIVNSLNDV